MPREFIGVRHRQINLLESELKAPGRAVAFVDAARAAFGT